MHLVISWAFALDWDHVAAKLRCIDVWPSFTHFVAGVCRSLLLWCRFKWHIIFEVFDIVYGSLVLQCLQTVCFVCNFFYHRPVSWPETQNATGRRTYETTGHLQFQFPANSCCPTNVQFKQFLQLWWKHRVGQPIGLDCRPTVKVSPPLSDAYRNIFATQNIILRYIFTSLQN